MFSQPSTPSQRSHPLVHQRHAILQQLAPNGSSGFGFKHPHSYSHRSIPIAQKHEPPMPYTRTHLKSRMNPSWLQCRIRPPAQAKGVLFIYLELNLPANLPPFVKRQAVVLSKACATR